jgi:hypothetical protein
MSESFNKIVEQLINPSRIYRNSFIEELPESHKAPPKDTRTVAQEEQEGAAIDEKEKQERIKAHYGERPSPWASKSDDEKRKALTSLLVENEKRKKELLKTKESLDEKSMVEELSDKEAQLFTKVGDQLSNLVAHKDKVEKAWKELGDPVASQ